MGLLKIVHCKRDISHCIRDKDDEKILSLAIKSNSDVLITGDKDILEARESLSFKILTPREFLLLIKKP